jgi:hypothetical protein
LVVRINEEPVVACTHTDSIAESGHAGAGETLVAVAAGTGIAGTMASNAVIVGAVEAGIADTSIHGSHVDTVGITRDTGGETQQLIVALTANAGLAVGDAVGRTDLGAGASNVHDVASLADARDAIPGGEDCATLAEAVDDVLLVGTAVTTLGCRIPAGIGWAVGAQNALSALHLVVAVADALSRGCAVDAVGRAGGAADCCGIEGGRAGAG